MSPGETVFSSSLKDGRTLTIRYVKESDLDDLLVYINKLSQERTFIRFQGEVITREEEEKFVHSIVAGIKNRSAVILVAICEDQLVGITQISLGEKTEKHIGLFGITVAKAYRGEGIGTLLMQTVIAEAKKNLARLEIINLLVFANNQRAKQMYQQAGFAEYGRLPNGIKLESGYDDCIFMYMTV